MCMCEIVDGRVALCACVRLWVAMWHYVHTCGCRWQCDIMCMCEVVGDNVALCACVRLRRCVGAGINELLVLMPLVSCCVGCFP